MGNFLPRIRLIRRSFEACRREKGIRIRRKRYSHKETQTYSYSPGTVKEHLEGKDYMNTKDLWYSTITHDEKCETSAANTSDQTEYAIVNMPKKKQTTITSEDNNEYDYVLVN